MPTFFWIQIQTCKGISPKIHLELHPLIVVALFLLTYLRIIISALYKDTIQGIIPVAVLSRNTLLKTTL